MKVQSKELLHAILFLPPKSNKKSRHQIFFKLPILACRGALIPCFKINSTFFFFTFSFEEYFSSQVKINQMIKERSVGKAYFRKVGHILVCLG